jgi:hypothetical protein
MIAAKSAHPFPFEFSLRFAVASCCCAALLGAGMMTTALGVAAHLTPRVVVFALPAAGADRAALATPAVTSDVLELP